MGVLRAFSTFPRPLRLLVGAASLTALLSACGEGESARHSILLVTLDTTRWDRVGTYGDPSARTPELDAVARRGVLFRLAFVDAPTTLPSHTTMLTGAFSLRHGVRLNDTYALPEEAKTLPEIFAERGYATAAVVSSVTLAAEGGLDQGFTRYDDDLPAEFECHDPALAARTERFVGTQRRADQTTAAAQRALLHLTSPAFVWVHYVDAHLTYDPPPPWNRIPGLSPYAGEIAFADREMGRLLRAVAERLGPAIVAILSDHGEGLGDHREDEHGMFLYDTTVRIPFVLSGPGVSGRIESGIARNADLAPTLAGLAGLDAGAFPDGVDLLAAEPPAPDWVLSESLTPTRFHGGSRLKALRTDGAKYVLAPDPELYDLTDDPGETRNLLAGDPARRQELHRPLVEIVTEILEDPTFASAQAAPVDDARREALEALGYLGAGRAIPHAPETTATGIDPKDLIDVTRSVRYVMDGRYDEARPRMTRFWGKHRTPSTERLPTRRGTSSSREPISVRPFSS
jgi:arylsulfatase A-like enzyme